MTKIPAKEILAQLKRDLIGKDSHRGVTLTYSWIANQFGHFSLGFIPTVIVYFILKRYTNWSNVEFWSALIIASAWLIFEIYNFLGPLITKRISTAEFIYVGGNEKYRFEPKWKFIAFDTGTDVLFFILGSFSCATLIHPVFKWNGLIALITLVILIFPISYWFISKMYLQNAGYPIQFRLSQWDYSINDSNKKVVDDFLEADKGHLLIFGSRQSGKSELAIGIANLFSNERKRCHYSTGVKLYSKFYLDPTAYHCPNLWDWHDCDCLVVDDINPGYPVERDLLKPDDFLQLVRNPDHVRRNETFFKTKRVIWVFGEPWPGDKDLMSNWTDMVLTLGVAFEDIYSVDLNEI